MITDWSRAGVDLDSPLTAEPHERRIALERRLLAATEKSMVEGNGTFAELSVDRLATAAGTSRAPFYIYFEDKGHLLRRLAEQVLADVADAARNWWQAAERNNPEDLRVAMKAILATYRQHQLILSAVVEAASYDEGVAEVFNGLTASVTPPARSSSENRPTTQSGRCQPPRSPAS